MLRTLKTDNLASLRPITHFDGTIIRLQRSGDHFVVCVRIGGRETSRPVDVGAAERFWMGMKGALPVTQAVEAMKDELLNAQEKARLTPAVPARPAKDIPG